MKKIFFELTSNSKKRERRDKHMKHSKVPELIGQEIVSVAPTKSFKVKELLKDSELRFIEDQYNKEGCGPCMQENENVGKYIVCAFMDTVVDEKGDVDASWLESCGPPVPSASKSNSLTKTPDMREYFEKRSIAANFKCGDSRMLRKLFWFREKECHEVKARFLNKSLSQFRKSLHFSQMFVYLSKKLEMPPGSHVLKVAWSSCDGFLACGSDNGGIKVLKIEVIEQQESPTEEAIGRPRGYLAAPTNISKNQTLEGHSAAISAMAWNQKQKKLTTADTKGLTIVWKYCRGSWCEEMVHNREGAAVQDLAWTTCGKKICIVYQDGAVMAGSVEGSRLWGHDSIIQNASITTLTWSPNGSHALFAASNGHILVYTHEGTADKKIKLKRRPGLPPDDSTKETQESTDIVCIRWHKNSTSSSWTVPSLAVVWRSNCIHFLRNLTDEHPIMITSHMVATCGSWSANGDFLAVGGSPTSLKTVDESKKHGAFDQVNVYSPFGSLLQTLRIPGNSCSTLSWDSLSLRLAIGVGENVYFANVRPCYKFALVGEKTLVYAFTRSDGTVQIGFWDGSMLSLQEVPGKVVDIKGDDEHCAVLSLTTTGCYNVTILNTRGDPVDSITIVTIDPFMINLAGSLLICVAANAITIWRFDNFSTSDVNFPANSGIDLVARRRIRSFHIDESPSIIGESTEEAKLKEPTKDPASCSDAVGQMLLVCRESGKLQVYSLPHGALMNTIDTAYEMNFRPSHIWLNMDGSQVAMIDRHGHLSVCSLGSASIKTALARKLDRKDVWNLVWARDHPNLICVMEKTKMYVIRNGEAEEPLLTSAYLASFKDLKVISVLMDELMFNPEEPRKDLILTFETRTLRQTNQMLKENTSLQEIHAYIQSDNHCSLWKILGNEAVRQNELELAEACFVKAKDYAGISKIKKLSYIVNSRVRKAEVMTYFGEFEKAEQFYLQAERKDLAVEMWRLLDDWKRVDSTLPSRQRIGDTFMKDTASAKGDIHFENQEWTKALSHFETAGETGKIIECYLMLEDYTRLEKMAETMRDGDPLLRRIGDIFKSRGLCLEAVNAYLKYDNEKPELAVQTAIHLSHWSLALQVSQQYSLQMVEPLLVQNIALMLEEGRILTAVQLMINSNKPFGAGKLLIITALRELEDQVQDLVRIKKLLVFAAMLFEYRSVDFTKQGISNCDDNGDVFFENTLPQKYKPSHHVYKWIRESPWRGAEAVHYLLVTQRLLYSGCYEEATKTALYLRCFEDILGKESVYSIITLAAANSANFAVCSKALTHLEPLGSDYEDIVSDLFSENFPVDSIVNAVTCYKCRGSIPDYSTACPDCGTTFRICTITGRPLCDDPHSLWTCQVCRHSSDLRLVKSRHSCPFCHSERLFSLDNLE